MKIAYYCQHVLGIGHYHRSLEICKALARDHKTIMITGGPEVETDEETIGFFQLPGLEMDQDFKNLRPCNPEMSLQEVKNQRKEILFEFFSKFHPDIFLVELYPFGRKAFRFELDPILTGIRQGTIPPCLCFCSLRDILVEREDKKKFEERIVNTLNKLFDGLLIHSDERITPLDETFSRRVDLIPPIHYTGYVTPKPSGSGRKNIRKKLNLLPRQKLIVASIGGGNVGEELLWATLHAFKRLPTGKYFLQIFTGPYADEKLFAKLQELEADTLRVTRFTKNFPEWLAAADLSVSMAGYNTCMNILAAGTPALLYPFAQNQEQRMRVNKLIKQPQLHLLKAEELEPVRPVTLMERQIKRQRFTTDIDLDGAAQTAKILSLCHKETGARP